jgi:hypothetical protein
VSASLALSPAPTAASATVFYPSSYISCRYLPLNANIFYFLIGDFRHSPTSSKSRGSAVGIALGYGLDDRDCRVRFPAGTGNFSLYHRVQNGSGVHPARYPMGIRSSFPGGIAAGA